MKDLFDKKQYPAVIVDPSFMSWSDNFENLVLKLQKSQIDILVSLHSSVVPRQANALVGCDGNLPNSYTYEDTNGQRYYHAITPVAKVIMVTFFAHA